MKLIKSANSTQYVNIHTNKQLSQLYLLTGNVYEV